MPVLVLARSITYDLGTRDETYEWFNVRNARSDECVVTTEVCVPLAAPALPPKKKAPIAMSSKMYSKSGVQAHTLVHLHAQCLPVTMHLYLCSGCSLCQPPHT